MRKNGTSFDKVLLQILEGKGRSYAKFSSFYFFMASLTVYLYSHSEQYPLTRSLLVTTFQSILMLQTTQYSLLLF